MKALTLTAIVLFGMFTLMSAQPAEKCNGMKDAGCEQGSGCMGMDQAPGMEMDCMGDMSELKLTDAQKEQLAVARENHHKDVIKINADIETLEIDLRADMRNNNFQEALKVSDQISDKRKILAQKRILMVQTVMGILTPDQQKIMKENMGKMMGGERRHKKLESRPNRNCEQDCDKDKPHRERKDKDE